jgi:hypothetical protein
MSEAAPSPSIPDIHSREFWDRDRAGINADLIGLEYEAPRMTEGQYLRARIDVLQRIVIHQGMLIEAAYKELAALACDLTCDSFRLNRPQCLGTTGKETTSSQLEHRWWA